MSPICIELVRGLFTLAAVALGSSIALWMYFRQKEYELVKQRYLEGGIDVVATQLEAALGVISHNWARCASLCKSLRDAGALFDVKELERGFLPLDSSQFKAVAHHRVGSLLQSQIVWRAFQLAMAYATNANSRITVEFVEVLRIKMTNPSSIPATHTALAEKLLEDLHIVHRKGFEFASLQRELHALGLLLEAARLSLSAIGEFHQQPAVQEVIARLTQKYPAELSEDESTRAG